MKGLRKYLLGGLVGAIFGFLIAPKRAQKVRDALLGRDPAPALPEQLMRSLPPGLFSPGGEEGFASSVPEARPEPATIPVAAPPASAAAKSAAAEPAAEAAAWAETDAAPITYPPETEAWPPPPPPAATIEEEPVPLLPVELREVEVEAELQEMPPALALEAEPQEALVESLPLEEEPPELMAEVGEEAVPAPASEPASRSSVETDLRARIEETRRRIREEMERPFRIAEGAPEEPEARESLSALSSEAPRRPPEPLAPAPAPPVASRDEVSPPSSVGQPRAGEGEFDYEAMRRRIEETRSRLKAKAFDALMSGETSLLAHDKSAVDGPASGAHVSLDDDVDQSIESGLSAEDT